MGGAFPLVWAVARLQRKVALYTETELVTYLLFFLVFFLPYEELDFLLVFFTDV